ncbi:sodium channel modifier 1 [Trichomycterus rosablanca]|uniref:sodium channel modifier 1 n=1 Tax=Trichomycterus rosablanca TaxID=2290929 RepID=UPI002F3598AE
MSFKREGDDQSQLNVLKKRRVADLLSNFIPEDEASLLKNGRYCCLVCSHRPIFDTVDILTVHRKGKRHLEGIKWFYGKKTQLKHEVVKRQHQEYVKQEDNRQEAGSSAPLLTETRKITHHALLRATPYSSCHKKACERTENPSTQLDPDFRSHHGNNSRPIQNVIPTAEIKISKETKPVCGQRTSTSQCQNEILKRKKESASVAANTLESEPLTEQRRRELEEYLKLKSAGWIQDPSGKWIKDENVEFDSDEEEPASLLPSSEDT